MIDAVRSTLVLFLGVLAAVLVSGCGGSSTASRLQSRLLSAADLPAGWSAVAASASPVKVTNTPCLARLAKNPKGWSYQTAAFVEGKSIPNLGEVLATGRASRRRRGTNSTMPSRHCRSAMLQSRRHQGQGHRSSAWRSRGSASRSSAYAWAFTLAGIRLGFDLVLFQTGRYDGYLSYADLGPPATATVEAFARAAVAKAQTGATAPVPDSVSIASAPVRAAHTRLGTVAYRAIGTGRPLLLITGYSGTMESWDPQFVDALAQHYRVITLDNAGIGKSENLPAPLTIDAMADQTSALIAALGPRTHRRARLVDGQHDRPGPRRPPPRPGATPRALRQLPRQRQDRRPSRRELNAFESGEPQQVMAALFPADQTAAQNTYLAAISSYPPASPAPANVSLLRDRRSTPGGTEPTLRAPSQPRSPRRRSIADGTVDRLDPIANSQTLAKLIHGANSSSTPTRATRFLFQDQTNFVPTIESFLQ